MNACFGNFATLVKENDLRPRLILRSTRLARGETVTQPLKERFDYEQNPDKAQDGELIFSYECDYMTANTEFLLSKPKYKATTGREQRRDSNVLCYQIRQSFRLREIPPGGGKPGGF